MRSIALLAPLLLLFGCGGGGDGASTRAAGYTVGAYYSLWYPSNFSEGTLRRRLAPPQPPALGEYDSGSAAVAEVHVTAAADHGVDFFAVDWWPDRPGQNAALDSGLLRAPSLDRIRFCIFYNSGGLQDRSPGLGIRFDAAVRDRFVADLVGLSRRYFGHPSYLRVDGRPVVIVYLSREWHGLFREALDGARAALAAEGHDPFLIGDEVFWAVIVADEDPNAPVRVTDEPQRSRIGLFDAITGYNLYAVERTQDRGYGASSAFLDDGAALYRRYSRAADVPFVPGVIPGYNDRGTRLAPGRFAIPRRLSPEAAEGSFFAAAIERLGKPFVDGRLGMITITSWNEWNEDTAIEPTIAAPATSEDATYTEGYAYEGFGTRYLEIVRDELGG
jgi:glycoprotein endo-alpha-1,2-mannosidase